MKKIMSGLVLTLSLGLFHYSYASAGPLVKSEENVRPVEIVANGEFIKMDVHPLMDNNRLFVPIRALASLGLSYSFNSTTSVATVQNKEGDYLKISANSSTAYKNDKAIQMDVPAQNSNGRILVPIRFVSESLGYKVQYESIRKFVFVNSQDYSFDSKLLYQDDLQAARKAAIALPINRDFIPLGTLDGYRLHQYTFPHGRADTYYFNDGNYTFVQIKDGDAIAIGQLYRERGKPSQARGNVSPEMSLDRDPFMEPFDHRSVLFFENDDGMATIVYQEDKNEQVKIKTKMNIYSDIIQKLPDHK
ncbi:copper amine oxidase N-terminal domain-containing protein [Lysinibacillus sp. NPDC056232]|uniref:copper amine oxidase N-terminal domain-containing protein n=1 Tax=Lysinibacillus sp. NPDC056232 TaxID=3345756 RepID=UPI0035D543DD